MVAMDGGMCASEASSAFCAWVVFGLVFFGAVTTSAIKMRAVFLSVSISQAFRALGFQIGSEVVVDFAVSVEEG